MARRRNKKIAPFWGTLAAIGLVCAIIVSTNGNLMAFKLKMPFPTYICAALLIMLVITLPNFLEYATWQIRLLIMMAITISSALTINAYTSKEIIGSEDRLKTDYDYNDLKAKAERLEAKYDSANVQLNNYIFLQVSSTKSWNDGARASRIQRDTLFNQMTRAWVAVDIRKAELKNSGTVSQESFINPLTTLSFNQIPVDLIKFASNLIFSCTDDLSIPIFAVILRACFPNIFIIRLPKSKKSGLKRFGNWFGKWLKRVRRMFDKSSQKFDIIAENMSASSLRGGEKVRTAVELKDMYPNLTQIQIGEIMGKMFRNNGKAYKKNTVCEWLKEEYERN